MASHPATAPARPYRSHLQPACLACRRRKSRCHSDGRTEPCLMCQAHGTDCSYPPEPRVSRRRANGARTVVSRTPLVSGSSTTPEPAYRTTASNTITAIEDVRRRSHRTQRTPVPSEQPHRPATAFTSTEDQQSNLHIIGPAVANDSQVLSEYLSRKPETPHDHAVAPVPASRSRSVLFTRVDKRPLGTILDRNPAAQKLETIERIVEPWGSALIDL